MKIPSLSKILLGLTFLFNSNLMAVDLSNRLGVGLTQQYKNNLSAISLKVQKSNAYAFGATLGLSTSERHGGYTAGLKIYRIIFQEPNLNFFSGFGVALISEKINYQASSGYQADVTLGSEFHLKGIESIGFSFEFGLSMSKIHDDAVFETSGHNLIQAAIHFYI